MRSNRTRLVWVLVGLCCAGLLAVIAWPVGASSDAGDGGSAAVGRLPGGMSLASLDSRAVESLTGDPLAAESGEVRRTSPEAFAARRRSRTAYEHLGAAAAARVARETFPAVVEQPADEPPKLPAGTRIVRYLSDDAAQLTLPHGEHGVVESTVPIAVTAQGGGHVPVDLALHEAGGAYSPDVSPTEVRIAKTAGGGASLPGVGVSLTPVDAQGRPLGGAQGSVQGSTVFYGDTATDSDTLAKPTTGGVQEDTLLRSPDSPRTLYFKLGLPAGARLAVEGRSGAARVVDAGQTIATVPASGATDAEGAPVPVSTSVSGRTLALSVGGGGEYRYPIDVDPEMRSEDTRIEVGPEGWTEYLMNWVFGTTNSAAFNLASNGHKVWAPVIFDDWVSGDRQEYKAGEDGFLAYRTQGESNIYKFSTAPITNNPEFSYEYSEGIEDSEYIVKLLKPYLEAVIFLDNPHSKVIEKETLIPDHNQGANQSVCSNGSCTPPGKVSSGNDGNEAFFEVQAKEKGSEAFTDEMAGNSVDIVQEKGPSVSFDTSDRSFEYNREGYREFFPNAADGEWIKTNSGTVDLGIDAFDPGTGISAVGATSPDDSGWGFAPRASSQDGCAGSVQCNECDEGESECKAIGQKGKPLVLSFSELGTLPEGEDTVEATVEDAEGLRATAKGIVRIDNAPPTDIVLNGLPTNRELYPRPYHVEVEATDGSGKTPSSGVKSIALFIDGKRIGSASGYCAPGPCKASAEWVLNAGQLASGKHLATIIATDNVGNVGRSNIEFTVYPTATPVSLGPGAVNPVTGELRLESTDVSMGPGLTVTRSYGSRHLEAGVEESVESPLGQQWSISLAGQERLFEQPDGSMVLTGSNGSRTIFSAKQGGGFESPSGDANLVLSKSSCEPGVSEYMLADPAAGTATCFKVPAGGSGKVWTPSEQTSPEPDSTVIYRYEATTTEGNEIVRPHVALAPVPQNVTCPIEEHKLLRETLKAGCRALVFEYSEATGASGENRSEWGEYNGRLKEIKYVAYNPASKAMSEVGVAAYLYDRRGRLRAEWDPRIVPSLKTTYGYDSEGHVTALDVPDREPWVFIYGGIAGDIETNRLLKATQGTIAEGLWNGALPQNTKLPTIKSASAPLTGESVEVEGGSWSNSPIAYAYQWEDCNSAGEACTPIHGANQPKYVLNGGDVAPHRLAVAVTATNGGGSTTVKVLAPEVQTGMEYTLGDYEKLGEGIIDAGGVAEGPEGDMWILTKGHVEKVTPTGAVTSYSYEGSPAGCPGNIVDGPNDSMWFTGTCSGVVGEISTSGSLKKYQLPNSYEAHGIAYGPDGDLWLTATRNYAEAKIDQMSPEGKIIKEYELPGGGEPWDIAVGPDKESLWFTVHESGGYIGEITPSGEVRAYRGVRGIPGAITAGPEGDMWFTETNVGYEEYEGYEGKWQHSAAVGKITTSGSVSDYLTHECLYGGEKANSGIAAGPEGDLWVGNCYGSVEKVTPTGEVTNYPIPAEHEVTGVAIRAEKFPDLPQVWTASYDSKFGKEGTWTTKIAPTVAESEYSEVPGWTVDYGVPISGSRAPFPMGEAEVATWGQKDDPVEATAIFPPDAPEGWPPVNYWRATVYYMDKGGRTVNVANPNGGISTTEYNEQNDVVRTLSADNRETALKEGTKSVEAAKLLDSESTYNSEGSELESTLGPRHLVKLANGKEVQARTHTLYSYDEGAPAEGGPYRLVTKVTQGASVEGEGEQDVRTTTTSYSGQGGLGWKLRKPTSVTSEPSGLKMTRTTLYNESTGAPTETRMPGWTGGTAGLSYSAEYKPGGTNKLSSPDDIAIDSSGDIWVADTGNDRVEAFNGEGRVVQMFGREGSGNGEFNKPEGIAVADGHVWVSDTGNKRIQEFNTEGEYLGQIDSGLSSPEGIRVDSKGDVWVADPGKNQVVEYSPEGLYLKTVEMPTGAEPSDLGFNAEGKLYVLLNGLNKIEELGNLSSTILPTYMSEFGDEGTETLSSPWDIATDESGNVWVADTANNRIVEFNSEGKFVRAIGKYGTGHGEFIKPEGIAASGTTVWVADTGNDRVEKFDTLDGVYEQEFGSRGSGNGEFEHPEGLVVGPEKTIWVADSGNNRVEEFNNEGIYLRTVGGQGTGDGQFEDPTDVGMNSSGELYVLDHGNHRVEQFANLSWSTVPSYSSYFGSEGSEPGRFKAPEDMTTDSSGDIWVADTGNDRVEKFSSEGSLLQAFGRSGTGNGEFKDPDAILANNERVWVSDSENDRVQEFNTYGVYLRQFGAAGSGAGQFKGPGGLAVDSNGDVWVADEYNNRIQEFSSSGSFIEAFGWGVNKGEDKLETCTSSCREGIQGSGNGQFHDPTGVAFNSEGDLYVTDLDNYRVQEFDFNGKGEAEYMAQFGSEGSGNGQMEHAYRLTVGPEGDVWLVDTGDDRIERFTGSGVYISQVDSLNAPRAVSINGPYLYVLDSGNAKVERFSFLTGEYINQFGSAGKGAGQMENAWRMSVGPNGYVWLSDSSDSRVEVFSGTGTYVGQFGGEGYGTGQFDGSTAGVSVSGTNVYVLNSTKGSVERFSLATGEKVREFGEKGKGNGQMETAWRMSVGPEGNVWLSDSSDNRVEEFSGTGEYKTQFGVAGKAAGQFKESMGVGVYGDDLYALDSGNDRYELWKLRGSAHAARTIYYTAAENAEFSRCGGRPEWANLVCESLPAAQPETSGLPSLAVTTVESYNMWGEPLVTVSETLTGSEKHTRTTTDKYDEAGRLIESQVTSTNGKALPPVKYKYEEASGTLIEESTTSGGKTESLKSEYDTLGDETSYTDASGNVSTFEYENEPFLGTRLYKTNDGKGTQTYGYGEFGEVVSVADSAAGTFTATYDVEGNLVAEGLPNGMVVKYTRNSVDGTTGVEYVKSTDCSEKCLWFKENATPSIHGQTLSQALELEGKAGKDAYTFDGVGRLTEAQEEPVGSKRCTTRIYGYDEETDRTSLTVDEPNSKGECSTTNGGTVEKHTYDEADRLLDSGTTYEPFGEISSLPGADAGGSTLKSSFYADGQLAEQTQGEQTIGYTLDPEDRTLETVSTGKVTADVTDHYSGIGDTPAWTSEQSGKWTRNITGIGGNLSAVQYNGETPVLQVANLHGDVVATVQDSETAKGLLSTVAERTAYGAPVGAETPPKYSWLGAHELATELPSGVVDMGARSYVPQLGRFLQPDPIPGGSANPYAYTYGDPVNTADLSGEYTMTLDANDYEATGQSAAAGVARLKAEIDAAIEEAQKEEAERQARIAAEEAARAEAAAMEGEEWEEEWEEEEGEEYEEAAYHHKVESGKEHAHVEPGVVWELPGLNLGEVEHEGHGAGESSASSLCETTDSGACTRPVGKKKRKSKCSPSRSDPDRGCNSSGGEEDKTCGTYYACPQTDPKAGEQSYDCPEGTYHAWSVLRGDYCAPEGDYKDTPGEDPGDGEPVVEED